MDDPGDRIAQHARDLVRRTAFRARFAKWTNCHPPLGLLAGPESLLRIGRYPHHVRDQGFASVLLVHEDRQEASLLLEVLRPGMAVRTGWLRGTHEESEAWQELITSVLETAGRVDPDLSRNGIARHLLHQARQKAGPKRRQHVSRRSVEASLTELAEDESAEWANPLPSAHALITEAEQSGAISTEEAALIRATRLDGFALQEAAPEEPYDRIQKRRRRAEARLAAFVEERYSWIVRKRRTRPSPIGLWESTRSGPRDSFAAKSRRVVRSSPDAPA